MCLDVVDLSHGSREGVTCAIHGGHRHTGQVGDGETMLFWEDFKDRAPRLWATVRPALGTKRTVREAIEEGAWIRDVGPNIKAATLREFLDLWIQLQD
jgi:hypothetical protein